MSENTENFFINEESGTINIELLLNESDRDQVLSTIMKSLNKNIEIIPGAVVKQLYFKGKDVGKIFESLKNSLKEETINKIDSFKL